MGSDLEELKKRLLAAVDGNLHIADQLRAYERQITDIATEIKRTYAHDSSCSLNSVSNQISRLASEMLDAASQCAKARVRLDEAQRVAGKWCKDGGGGVALKGDSGSAISAHGAAKSGNSGYKELKAIVDASEPGSSNHCDARWELYQLDGGTWLKPVWEKVYRSNMERARKANAGVVAEGVRLGWSEKEYPFKGLSRRLDLAEPATSKGAEVKAYAEGRVYNTSDIRDQVAADAKIVKKLGWEITWIFIDCEPSSTLKADLHAASITIELRTKSEGSSRLVERIPPPKTTERMK